MKINSPLPGQWFYILCRQNVLLMEKILNGTYASMISDTAFKKCFGTEEFKEATIGLLNSVLPGAGITDVTFLPTELQGLSPKDRKGIIDVLCTTKTSSFIIEMQNASHSHFRERTVFYSSLFVLEQSRKGKDWNFVLNDTFVISFLNFSIPTMPLKSGEYLRHYVTKELTTDEKLPGSSEYLFFELTSFEKKESEVANDMEKWLYLLRNSGEMTHMPGAFEGKAFETFEKAALMAGYSQEEMIQYNKEMVTELDRKLELQEAKENAFNEGHAAGLEKGIEKERLNTARNMKSEGISVDVIGRVTGLTAEQIAAL